MILRIDGVVLIHGVSWAGGKRAGIYASRFK